MKDTMLRYIACLFALMFSAWVVSQGYSPVVRDTTATFTFERGNTVWNIWTQYGVVSWSEFYNASARFNPQHAHDRFRSVPIGSTVIVPLSVLNISPIVVEEAPLPTPSVTEQQFRELQGQTTILADSVEGIATALQNLERVVIERTAPAFEERTLGLSSLAWAVIALLLLVLLLTVLTILFLRTRVRDVRPVTVPDVQKEHELSEETAKLRKENEDLLVGHLRLSEEIRNLKNVNEILTAEKEHLKRELLFITGEEQPPGDVEDSVRKTRRGTHGRGRPYT
jgi:hypothetical protein